jgi:hypothetical protein
MLKLLTAEDTARRVQTAALAALPYTIDKSGVVVRRQA